MAQKHLGKRGYMAVRAPEEQQAVYQQRAEELGIAVSSYAVMRLAEAEGLPVPEWVLDEITRAEQKRKAERDEQRRQHPPLFDDAHQTPDISPRRRAPLARSA